MRKFNPSTDYHTVCEWWRQHNWDCVPKDCLPVTGYIIDDVCVGFLYKTDSKIAWLEYIVSNKNSDKEVRNKGLDKVIDTLINDAYESGFKALFTSVEHPALIERYAKHHFVSTDKNVTNMIRRL